MPKQSYGNNLGLSRNMEKEGMSSGTLVSELSGSADKVDKPDVYVDVPLNRGVQNSRMGNTGMTSNITAAIPEYEERNETDEATRQNTKRSNNTANERKM